MIRTVIPQVRWTNALALAAGAALVTVLATVGGAELESSAAAALTYFVGWYLSWRAFQTLPSIELKVASAIGRGNVDRAERISANLAALKERTQSLQVARVAPTNRVRWMTLLHPLTPTGRALIRDDIGFLLVNYAPQRLVTRWVWFSGAIIFHIAIALMWQIFVLKAASIDFSTFGLLTVSGVAIVGLMLMWAPAVPILMIRLGLALIEQALQQFDQMITEIETRRLASSVDLDSELSRQPGETVALTRSLLQSVQQLSSYRPSPTS